MGKVATVCGKVVRAKYATSSAGKPTFLDLDKPYPNAHLTIVIWQEERGDFSEAPEKAFLGEVVCIEGKVERYSGRVQITAAGGDIFPPAEFTPWPSDVMDCVGQGSHMTFGCSVMLDVVVDQWEIEAEQAQDAQDAYDSLMDDLYSDPGLDPWIPDYP